MDRSAASIRRRQTFTFPLCLSLAIAGLAAWMPVASAAPQTDVGAEDERLRRDILRDVPERATIPIELPPEGELPPVPESPPIAVTRVEVDGATALPDRERDALTRPVVGQSVTLPQLRGVAQAVTRWYRRHGYVTSRAVVPAQTIEGGMVRLRVVEGRIGNVRVEGNRYVSTQRVEQALRAQSGQLLWLPALEHSLATLNAHPDRTVRLVLAPGAEAGTTDLILQVEDHRPVHAAYAFDNLGTKVTGPTRHTVTIAHNNLIGRDDALSAMGLLGEFGGLQAGSVAYSLPITRSGAAATFEASGVRSDIKDELKSLRAHGTAVTLAPGLSVPLVQRARVSLDANAGFEYRRIRTYLDEVVTSKDDLRVARVGASLFQQDRAGRTAFVPELRIGLPTFMGGSHPVDIAASRAAAGGDFVRAIAQVVRAQRAPWGTMLLARGSGQLTSDRLVPAEQFRLGGMDTVRGYPEGEYLADAGYQWAIEYRVPVGRFVPALLAETRAVAEARRSVTLVGFWDFGEGFIRHPRSGEDADARLSGVGVGLHARPTEDSLLQVDLGWPVGDEPSEHDGVRLHVLGRVGF